MMKIQQDFKKIVKKGINQLAVPLNTFYIKKEMKKNRNMLLQRNVLKETLEGERILILAPHVDDDFIGCGGAISQYILHEKEVFIAYLTDSGKRGSKEEKGENALQRKNEALEVAKNMGIPSEQLFFLKGEDGALKNSAIFEALQKVIEDTKADTIFAPIFLDTHPDHIHTGVELLALGEGFLKNGNEARLHNTNLYFYEAQSPITQFYSNITLDITAHWGKKEKALEGYPSQKSNFWFAKENNRLNGILYQRPYCEVFLKTTFQNFSEEIGPIKEQLQELSNPLIPHRAPWNYRKSYQSSKQHKKPLEILLKTW